MADRLKALAFGGRKRGTLGGSLVNDMASLGKTIMLCGDCQGKFDWRHHQYYSVWRYEHQPVTGPCDVCRVQVTGNDGRLFIHESIRPKAWATPDEQKRDDRQWYALQIPGTDTRTPTLCLNLRIF